MNMLVATAAGGGTWHAVAALLGGEGGFNWHLFIVQALGFGILVAVLMKLAVPVIKKMLQERSKGISDRFDALDRDLAATSKELSDYEEKLRSIDAETRRRIQEAQDEGTRTRTALMGEAQAAASAELDKARRDIQLERDKAILELRAAVTDMTVAATEKALDAAMNEQVNGRMVARSLDGLGKGVRP